MGRHAGQWTAQSAPRESLVKVLDALSGGSDVEFHSQDAAGLHQPRESEGE